MPAGQETQGDATGKPAEKSGLATAALVFGLLSWLPGLGLLAMVLGRSAMNAIDRAEAEGRTIQGRDRAQAGRILGGLATLAWVALVLADILFFSTPYPQRRFAVKVKNSYNVHTVVAALQFYGEQSNDLFPTGGVHERFQALVNNCCGGNGVVPEILISPVESDSTHRVTTTQTHDPLGGPTSEIKWTPGGETNYSYSLLDQHNVEWRNKTNPSAVLVADRKGVPGGPEGSLWDKKTWQGTIGWGDSHVTFERSSKMATEYGGVAHSDDDLFTQQGTNDAYLIHGP